MTRDIPRPAFGEFVTLMALMMSLVALAIDAMLPALPAIGADLGVRRANHTQLVVSMLILGMALGQMIYGPLSDSIGRKPAILAGFALFVVGCLLALVAEEFEVLLVGRLLQGVGAAGPRTVTVALIRDQYRGAAMARVMSFVMAVFIVVPAIAPAVGQAILLLAEWRAIFAVFLLLAFVAALWLAIRQPETLPRGRRRPFSFERVAGAVGEVCRNPVTLGYTAIAGLVFGGFLGYLNSAQQIFGQIYRAGAAFPAYFAVLALAIGAAAVANGALVTRFGMQRMVAWALAGLPVLAAGFLAPALVLVAHPPLWAGMLYLAATFACVGVLFGNLNALSMEPLGHIAGVGAAMVGSLSTLIAVPLGIGIGQAFDGTLMPLAGGFGVLGGSALLVMRWTEARRVAA